MLDVCVCVTMPSPRMWGSARLMDMVSVNPGTLPTCRGGLPGAYLSALKIHLFSLHAWGSVHADAQSGAQFLILPTRVGVCPHAQAAHRGMECIPHTRGGKPYSRAAS